MNNENTASENSVALSTSAYYTTATSGIWGNIAGALVSALLLLPVPWMSVVIAAGLVWDQLWLRVKETAVAVATGEWIAKGAQALAKVLLRDERNAPYLYTLVGIGIYTPALYIGFFVWQMLNESTTSLPMQLFMAFLFNVLMMGPYFRFFSVVATLVHKEGHDTRGLFKQPFTWLNNVFGWFLGPFYGHVPEAYPMGHQRIHHKFDNQPGDVTCTLHLDRTKASSWFVYLRQFALYWSGISIVIYFVKRRQWNPAARMAGGMLCYYGIIAGIMYINPWFGFFYSLLPHLSVIIYLGAINYIWHTFCDPADIENEYINSVTILNGHYNVFNEDFHVTHHHHPQMHWTKMADDYYKNIEKYKANKASVFTDTQEFEMFMWVVLGKYDLLAEHYVDLTGTMTHEEKVALLKYRMQPIQL